MTSKGYRSRTSTHGRNMAGARSLWRATGMTDADFADSVEYMVNAHCADALICISNCDKITPGMLMAAMRLNIPTIFVSGGPMEAGKLAGTHGPARRIDVLVDAATLGKRRVAMGARGKDAWRPNRDRNVSEALRAYALMTTSAARGAVRDLSQLQQANRQR